MGSKTIDKNDTYVFLKSFGGTPVNEVVLGHREMTDLFHVYYENEWHPVPISDVDEMVSSEVIKKQMERYNN